MPFTLQAIHLLIQSVLSLLPKKVSLILHCFLLFLVPTASLFAQEKSTLDSIYKYYKSKEYEKAVLFAQKGIDEYSQVKDTNRLIKSYFIYGRILNITEDYKNSLFYHQKAYDISTQYKTGIKFFLKISNGLAMSYMKLMQYEQAIDIFERCIEDDRFDVNTLTGIAIKTNLSNCYSYIGKSQKAFSLLKESEKIALKLDAKPYLSAIWDEIGFEFFRSKKQYHKAISYVKRAHEIDVESQDLNEIIYTAKHLAILYQEIGNYKSALEYYQLAHNYEDSITSTETANKIAELNVKYNIEKKENELKLKNLLIKEQNSRIASQETTRYYLVGVLILIFISGTWLFVLLYKNRSKLKEIQSLNKDIRSMNQELEMKVDERTKSLKKQNEKLKNYSFLNSHKVRAPLTKILGFSNLIDYSKDHKIYTYLKESATELDHIIQEINSIIHRDNSKFNWNKNMLTASKIMLVDDDPMQNFLSKKILSFYDKQIEVIEYTNPTDALKDIENGIILPDVIFLDINMPDFNGWDFLTEMEKQKLKYPVVMLTSSIDPNDRIKAGNFQFIEAFFTKPLKVDDLSKLFVN